MNKTIEVNVRKTIESIKKDFLEYIQKNLLFNDYISVFVIGSFIGNNYLVKKDNDLDIRVMFKKVTYEKAQLLRLFLDECVKKHSNKNINICYSTVIGVAKPIPSKKISILIHLIYLDLEEFQRLPMIHTNTYIKFNQLLEGKPLIELKNINMTEKNIVEDFEGLTHCITMLKTNRLKYLAWEKTKSKYEVILKERDIENEELIHCIKYALFKPIINLINLNRVETNDVNKTIELILKNYRFRNLPHKEVILEFKQLENSTDVDKLNILKRKTIEFLISFEKFIKTFHLNEIMYEVEIVSRINDVNKLKSTLLNSKHIFVKQEKQVVIFLMQKGSKDLIRLVISPEKNILSFKRGSFGEAREELETEISNYETTYNLFIKLGFYVDTIFFRNREYYTDSKQQLTLTLDDTQNSMIVLEIEKMIENKGLKDKTILNLKNYAKDVINISTFIEKKDLFKLLDEYNAKSSKEVNFKKIHKFLFEKYP